MCHMKKTSSSTSKDNTVPSARKHLGKELLEEEEKQDANFNSRKDTHEKYEDVGLPEHLKNFKEFHSLAPPSSSKFMVLNRRIKRSSRYFRFERLTNNVVKNTLEKKK